MDAEQHENQPGDVGEIRGNEFPACSLSTDFAVCGQLPYPPPPLHRRAEVSEATRRMPERINLGKQFSTTMSHCMGVRRDFVENRYRDRRAVRAVMGFYLPEWQRGLVWTERQKISFIESAWRGVYLGTYTYNQADLGSPYDNLLIDGQQRMDAIERYLDGHFPVFGWHWSEVTDADRRGWMMSTTFGSYMTETEDEDFLRSYYDLMNFGGTAHKESERASLPPAPEVTG